MHIFFKTFFQIVFVAFISTILINSPAFSANSNLSKIITKQFIINIEKDIGHKIEYMPGHSNDYANCKEVKNTGKCEYWFMKKGTTGENDPAVLSLEIEKTEFKSQAKSEFLSEQANLVGHAITDQGDIALKDTGKKIRINGFTYCIIYESTYRNTIIGLIDRYFIKIDYITDIDNPVVIKILKTLRNSIL